MKHIRADIFFDILFQRRQNINGYDFPHINFADVAELADALDSGSSGGNIVGVRVPSSASTEGQLLIGAGFLSFSRLIQHIKKICE